MQKGDEKKEDSEKPEPPAAAHPARAEAPAAPGISAAGVLWTFGRCLSALLPVYLAGYYRLSTGLLAVGLVLYSGWRHTRDAKEARLRSAERLQSDAASGGTLRGRRDLPAWVSFPDVEKVEWLNKVLHQAWPFIGQYLKKLLMETIAPTIRSSSTHLQTLNFTKIDFGEKPMKVVGVKAHTENDRGQVLLDVYISYVGDVEIDVEVTRYFCKAGVKGIQLHGMMRVILEPLIEDVPIVGAVTMFFIRRPVGCLHSSIYTQIHPHLKCTLSFSRGLTQFLPFLQKLDINWTGLTNLLDIPGLNVMSDTMIMDIIASFLVLPNRLTVPLVPNLPVAQLRSPLPRGVVRIHLLEADRLAAKDNYVKGVMAGLSDPYAVVRVGPQSFTSRHQDDTLNPKWGEVYEVIVHEVPGQELEVEVYDKDPDQDDFLGRTKLDLGIVKKSLIVDEWIPLKDTETGRVRLKLEWLSLLSNTDKLDQVVQRNTTVASKTSDPASSAILAVYLDRAEAIPMKKGKEPSPMVQLSVQDITKESKTCWNTVTPQWEDAFTFFIQNPCKQDLDIQVKDHDHVLNLGSLSIPLVRLLSRPELTLDQWFQLEDSGSASRIYIKAVLRVLWIDEDVVPIPLSPSEFTESAKRPKHTTPDPSFATEGVLRIHLVGGQNLVPKDNLMGGIVKGKSDPYVKISVGGKTFKSHTIKENLNPVWNELYEMVLTQVPGQDVNLEVFDKDMDKDDFMGRVKISLSDLISAQHTDQWFPLSDVKSGRVHLILEWLPTLSEPGRLEQVLRYNTRLSFLNKAVPSSALMFVYVERAHDLPFKKSGKEPKAGAELVLGAASHKTKVCERSSSPQWDESFYFLIPDPREEMLIVKLSSGDQPLGSLVLPIKEVLAEPELVLDQWVSLDGAPASQILLRAELKILCSKLCVSEVQQEDSFRDQKKPDSEHKPEKDSVQRSGDPSAAPVPSPPSVSMPEKSAAPPAKAVSKGDRVVTAAPELRPQQTTPDPSFATEGVLRIHILAAQNLIAKDNLMGGMVKGKSDPYVKVHIGDKTLKTHVIKENLNPVWNEMYELVLPQSASDDIHFELFDKDIDQDDFLGRVKVSMSEIKKALHIDQWLILNEVKNGRLHVILEWLSKVSEPEKLNKALQLQSLQSYQNKAVPAAALLFVLLERAHSLPLKKSGKEPKPAAELVLGGTSCKTKVCDRSTSPQWNEVFYFLLHDPKEDMLIIKLSSAWEQPLGNLVLPVRELLSKPKLVLDQWLNLDGASAESQILLRAELKVLDSKIEQSVVANEVPSEQPMVEEKMNPNRATQPSGPTACEKPVDWGHKQTPSDATTSSAPANVISDMQVSSSTDVQPQRPTLEPGSEKPHPPSAPTVSKVVQHEKPTPAPSAPADAKVTSSTDVQAQQTTPKPGFGTEGVLRIHILGAQNLVAMDNLMGGMVKGKSDPYVKVHVGDKTFKSHVIKENLNPIWNEMYELVLNANPDLEVKFELFDKDLDSDDFLGRIKLILSDIVNSQYSDKWYTLNDVKSGQVHLILEWLPTVSNPNKLDQVLQLQSLQSYQNKAVPSAALLFVLLERAHSLPLKKSGKEPKAAAELVLRETSHKTKVCDRGCSPRWDEHFYFLVHDPKQDMLILKLSSAWDQPLGNLVLPVKDLLSKPKMVLDQWLHLDGTSFKSQILLRAELKILESKMMDPAVAQKALLSAAPSGQAGKHGQINLTISYATIEKKLNVTVHSCRGLVTSSKDGLDTYVSLILLPDKSKATKKKTGVKKKDLNPEYNERFEIDLSLDEVQRRSLSVCVKNNSASFMSRDVVGQVQIEMAQIDLLSGVTKWFDLREE
ncbi:extended synaptotagmin-1 isoform X2 [Denticeps clupeoides]|uniref:extended synaptotagmin-1 isoform X2 n=1 Tax=Denticeps clupeoides TaxID=299321 RepID=UPI0010A3CF2B|nr:extended synaptotagmin-1-like isoform X2 [Denticeps clupeoides]